MMSGEDELYMKIVALDEIYNFVALSFFLFKDINMLKKLIINFKTIIIAYMCLSH
jgi:hypothetical protein